MPTHEQTLFTPAEAAALTRLPLKAVNNAIDKRTIAARVTRRRGVKSARLVRRTGARLSVAGTGACGRHNAVISPEAF
jgi:hypothetical protein